MKRLNRILWVLVAVAVAFWLYQRMRPGPVVVRLEPVSGAPGSADGRVFAELPWKRLPHLPGLQLTERSGRSVGLRDVAGKPFVVNFFFANCPSICRNLNRQAGRLQKEFRDSDLLFLSITVDPENDTPERLREYAGEFDADPEKWMFLTGKPHLIENLLGHFFRQASDGAHHTTDLFLFDRWGRYRDRFSWDDPEEMRRFSTVAQEVIAETEPPLEKTIQTRNLLASIPHSKTSYLPWLFDFQLQDSQGAEFWSRDLTGRPWIANLFFTTCPTTCPQQTRFLSEIEPDVAARNGALASITVDPHTDPPAVLREYARKYNAGPDWHFLTGDSVYIQRVGSEFLGIAGGMDHHSTLLVVVDRWGQVRARVDWQAPGAKEYLIELLDRLSAETIPVPADSVVRFPAEENQ